MRLIVIVLSTITLCLFSGCKEDLYPKIQEYGETDWIYDDVNIQVYNAKRGLKGYEIIENEDEIDVIFHYEKLEQLKEQNK